MNKAFNYTPKYKQTSGHKQIIQGLESLIESFKNEARKMKRANQKLLRE